MSDQQRLEAEEDSVRHFSLRSVFSLTTVSAIAVAALVKLLLMDGILVIIAVSAAVALFLYITTMAIWFLINWLD